MKNIFKDVENFKYNFWAFFFTFAYYFSKGDWLVGSILLIVEGLIPMKDYFLLGLLVGYLATNKLKPSKTGVSVLRFIISCISVVVFCTLKMVKYSFVGSL